MRGRALMAATLMLTLLLAGCTSDEPDDEVPADTMDQGPGSVMDEGLTVDSVVDAPEWSIGDYFGHHIFFGSDDAQGSHIDTVVAESNGGEWILKTDDEEAAKWEAAWDFPMLGPIDKKSLQTTAFTADWNIYDFPLSDGKQWTANFNPLLSGARELTLTASFDDSIKTRGQGTKEGFRIEGVNANGEVELFTDYIPEIGWYSELTYFDRITTPETEDFVIQVFAMGQGTDWSGTLIDADATLRVGVSSCFAPLNADGTPNQNCLTAAALTQFEVEEGTAELYGLTFLLAIAGHSAADLFDSKGFMEQEAATSQGIEDVQTVFTFHEIKDPTPGLWNHKWDGEGFVTVGYTQLWSIEFTETAFGA